MATLLPEGKQSFTNGAGAPLVGGKVYTYDAGTNTPRTTYQDAAATVPNTNPVVLDARGEATIFWNGAYKVVLKDALDVTIWTVDNITSTDLSTSAGAGLIGFLYSATYAAGTVGKWLKDLALSTGASFIGWIQSGTNAVLRTIQDKLRDTVSIKDFGAVGDGVTDDTSAIQSAINSLGAAGGVVLVPNSMRCLIDNNLTINANICLRGPHAIVGSPNNNLSAPYGSVGGALLVNPTKTITVKGGASLQGLLLHRKGMTFPAPDSSAFSGTAVTLGGDDAAVFQCMFLGFAQAITSSGWQRPRIYDVNVDCLAGVLIDNCADIVYLSKVHCWPFATIAALGAATTLQRSGAAFKFTTLGDWNKVSDCFAYGYSRGFWVSSCNSMTLLGCAADSTGSFAGQIGFMADGGSTDTRFIGCQAAAQETGYRIATVAGVHTRMIGCDSWACTNHGTLIDSGDVTVLGGIQRNTANGITINSAASKVNIDDVRFDAILGSPINCAVANADVRIGDNDYGTWAAGNAVVNNANRPVSSIASADPINLPAVGNVFQITGTTGFGTVNGGWSGRMVVFKFTGALTVSDGGASLKLNGNFVTTADDTLTLIHDGTAWYEVARSAN